MTLTPARPGRSDAPPASTPSHSREPRAPRCDECATDHYLKILLYLPATGAARARRRTLREHLGRVIRPARPAGGNVEYFCQKCGMWQRHPFPQGWEPRGQRLTPHEVQELPAVFVSPGEALPAHALCDRLEASSPSFRAEKTPRRAVVAARAA